MPVIPGKPSRRRFVVVACVLALAALITHLTPLLNAPIEGANYARRVNLQLGRWSGTEREIDEETASILQTDDVVDRRYVRVGEESWVDLTIIFAKEQRKVAHPPEVCLKGAGYSLQEYSRPIVPSGLKDPTRVRVVRLRIEKSNRKYLVYYMYKCGRRYSASYYWENLLIIWSRITLRPANGALIKLTTPIKTDEATSEKRLEEFMALAMPEIAAKLP